MQSSSKTRHSSTFTVGLVIALATALAAFVFGASPANAAPIGTISGVVKVAGVGTAGVEVTLYEVTQGDQFTAATTATGAYAFTGLEPGTYFVEVADTLTHSGFYNGQDVVITTAAKTKVHPVISLSAYKVGGSHISGIVTDAATGLPISDVDVSIDGFGVAADQWGTTAEDGSYSFDSIPAGTFGVRFGSETYGSVTRYVTFGNSSTRVLSQALRLADSGIEGRIVDEAGDPVVGERIYFALVADRSVQEYTTTNDNGEYAVGNMASGDWTLSFGGIFTPFTQVDQVVTLPAGESLFHSFTAPERVTSIISGTVKTVAGAAIPGICVTFSDAETGGVVYTEMTAANGSYVADQLEGGTYNVLFWDCQSTRNPKYATTYLGGTASVTQAATVDVALETGATSAGNNIALRLGGSIAGHVNAQTVDGVFELGNRYLNATVYQLIDGAWLTLPYTDTYSGTDQAGNYLINGLAPGTYRIGFSEFSEPDTAYRTFDEVFFTGSEALEGATSITVASGVKVVGKNVTVHTDQPVTAPSPVETSQLVPSLKNAITAPATAKPGSPVTITVGAAHRGEWVSVWAHSAPTLLGAGWAQVSKTGTVTVPIPSSIENGIHQLVVLDASGDQLGWRDVTLGGGAYGDRPGSIAVDSSVFPLQVVRDSWPAGTTFAYQWLRGATAVVPGTAIAGATTASYTPVAADRGQFVKVRVTASVPGYAPEVRTTSAVSYTLTAATGTVAVSGVAKVGLPLMADNTIAYTASGETVVPTFAYQWLRNGVAIAGATEGVYTQVAADLGTKISVRVMAKATGLLELVTTSAPTAAVVKGDLSGTFDAPVVTKPEGSLVLTAALPDGSVTDTGATTTYQWYRGALPIAGATKASYTLVQATDAGQLISVRVTVAKLNYVSRVLSSSSVNYTVTASALPGIAGAVKVGGPLTATLPTFTLGGEPVEPNVSYTWLRAGAAIAPAATASGYTPVTADVAKAVSVRVTAALPGYLSSITTSAATQPVGANAFEGWDQPLMPVTASTAGAVTTLTGTGTGTGIVPPAGPLPTVAYQWFRGDVAIAGATKSTYALTAADAGTQVWLRVTVSKATYTTVVKTSPRVDYSVAADGAFTLTPASPRVGTVLTVNQVNYSTKDGALSDGAVTYQWYRSGVLIAGQSSSSYTLDAADLGKVVTVRVTRSEPGYLSHTALSAPTTPVAVGVVAGTLGAPTVTASAAGVLSVQLPEGTVTAPAAPTLSYVWLRNNVAIAGATLPTYTLGALDVGKTVSVKVTVAKPAYTSVVLPVSTPVDYTLTASGVPTIEAADGQFRVGSTLTVALPAYSRDVAAPAYQWLRGTVAIAGATGASYVPVAADLGAKLSVRVTAVSASPPLVLPSGATVALAKGALAGTFDQPVVTVVAGKLAATLPEGAVTTPAVTLAYQWTRAGVAIAGATASTYALAPADFGKLVAVKVTVSKPAFDPATRVITSQGVDYSIVNSAPVVVGTVKVGGTLTVAPQLFAGPQGSVVPLIAYQWLRNGVAIAGGTSPSYVLKAADLNTRVSVRITPVAPGRVGAASTSVATQPVGTNAIEGDLSAPVVSFSQVGLIGTTLPGSVTTTGTTRTFQWFRDGVAIAGATSANYAQVEADRAKQLFVQITISKATYTTIVLTSVPQTFTVMADGVPTIDSTSPTVDDTLTATAPGYPGGFQPTEVAYQWLRDGAVIAGATSASYLVTTDDEGAMLSVRVTATAPGVLSSVTTSATTAVVVPYIP